MSFVDHLEVLRQMMLRVLGASAVIAIIIFTQKELVFDILLSPNSSDFCTYHWIEQLVTKVTGHPFAFEPFCIKLITTDLSSQFMTHITTSCYLSLLVISPYLLYELFRFVSPALYANERRYSVQVCVSIYLLFLAGVTITYFILFPISLRFLGTYSVAEQVVSTITLDSYIDTFVTLTLLMGVVFQLPVISFFLAKMGVLSAPLMSKYRSHAFVLLMVISAIITPPDIMTLIIVTIPLYLLYEISILVVRNVKE